MTVDRLLLVEDDATTREVMTLLLEADGWQVLGVTSGEEAVTAVRDDAGPSWVILCDLNLTGLQGAALAGDLRPLAPGAPLLAMSASSAAAAEESAYDAVLRKPFHASEVRAMVETVRARKSGPITQTGLITQEDRQQRTGIEALAVIRSETFLNLEQQMGARARDLYAFALADSSDRLRRMEASAADGDTAAFQKEAHALKGSAGMIGAERLAALAAGAETRGPGAFEGSSNETVRQMHLACDEIRLMLETLFPM